MTSLDSQSVLDDASFACGLTHDALARLVGRARWYVQDLRAAIQDEPVAAWLGRLRSEADAVTAVVQHHVDACVARALERGPEALASRHVAALIELADPRIRSAVVEYRPERRGGMLLTGPTGVGKSVAAVAILRREIAREASEEALRSVRYLVRDDGSREPQIGARVWDHGFAFARAADLTESRRQTPLGQGETPLVERATRARIAVIDDLGHERDPGAVWDVLSARYDAGRITVATSGWTVAALRERLGAEYVRRIVEARGKPGMVVEAW